MSWIGSCLVAGKKASKYSGRSGKHRMTGVMYDSGLEKRFLDQCYMQGIKVRRCPVKVNYKDTDGKWRTYSPDFELVDLKYVVEVKGLWAFKTNHAYVREKIVAALEKFKGRYTVVTEKELKSNFVAELHKGLVDGNRV